MYSLERQSNTQLNARNCKDAIVHSTEELKRKSAQLEVLCRNFFEIHFSHMFPPTTPCSAILPKMLAKVFSNYNGDANLMLEVLKVNWPAVFPHSKYSRIFSMEPLLYGERGGKPYHKPCGWRRLAFQVSDE